MNLRAFARARPCQIRLPGICRDANGETTVLAHARLIGISGMGLKANDLLGAHACFSCHQYCDTHHDAETKAAFADGVYRTIALLVKEDLLKW